MYENVVPLHPDDVADTVIYAVRYYCASGTDSNNGYDDVIAKSPLFIHNHHSFLTCTI